MRRVKKKDTIISLTANVLKGVAIISVFLHHYYRSVFGFDGNIQWQFGPDQIVGLINGWSWGFTDMVSTLFYSFGYIGVSIFFILSGWGLTHSWLQKKRQPSFGAFMRRRVGRVAPMLYVSIIAFFFFFLFFSARDVGVLSMQLLTSASLLHIYYPDYFWSYNSVYWFVSVLVILYLLFPMLYRRLRQYPHLTMVSAVFASYLISQLVISTPLNAAHPWFAMGGLPLVKAGEFTFGMWIALMLSKQSHERAVLHTIPIALVAAVTLAVGFLGYFSSLLYPLHPIMLSFTILVIVWMLVDHVRGLQPLYTFFAWLGLYSYGIYLFHRPIVSFVTGSSGSSLSGGMHLFVATILFALVLAIVYPLQRYIRASS